MREGITITKGHGTQNDFIIVADPEAEAPLAPEQVAAWCDRRAGLGADGVLRVTHAGALVDAAELDRLPQGVAWDDWFMDYRNADGSVAEMCGNGVRVFAHWLTVNGLAPGAAITVGTRAGARAVEVLEADKHSARVKVEMGPAEAAGTATAQLGNNGLTGIKVDVGNPHLACVLDDETPDSLDRFQLARPEFCARDFPAGANLEILTPLDAGSVAMRVYERGVGETRSCGTGTVAAARAALTHAGVMTGTVAVHVPGGRIDVEMTQRGSTLTGPSRIVAEAELFL